MKINHQLRALYFLEAVSGFGLAQVIWVVLLAGRGFSLAQIGLAEGFFHLVSFLCEVPSGMAADLFGRRRTLAASMAVRALACLAMIASGGIGGVCLAMGLSALSYNLISGTREAITYDSLLQAGRAGDYERVAGRMGVLYRVSAVGCALCAGAALALGWRLAYLTDFAAALAGFVLALVAGRMGVLYRVSAVGCALCAGAALALGWRLAYLTDFAAALAGFVLALGLAEPPHGQAAPGTIREFRPRLRQHVAETGVFLRQNPAAVEKMLLDGACGCCAYFGGQLLQPRLMELGLPAGLLGPVLALLPLAGAAGSALAGRMGGRFRFRNVALLCAAGIGGSLALAGAPVLSLALAAGAAATFWDGVLEVKMTARLNRDFPSDRRATLVSVQSMAYSLAMLPAAGAAATFWDGVLEVKMTARLNRDFPSDRRATLVSVQSMAYSLAMLPVTGAAATFWDGVLEVKMTARLNRDFPSDRRATLVSVQSMAYSLAMLPVSPLAGALCDRLGYSGGMAALGLGLLSLVAAGMAAHRCRKGRKRE